MKILLATHFFPPGHPGGTEAYTLGLATMLARKGHAPAVICAEGWGTGDSWVPRHEDTVYAGVPVRRLYWNWQLAPDPFVNAYDNPGVERHLAEYLRDWQPDLLHITSCYSLGAGVVRAARRAGVPTILTLTDFWFLCPRHTLLRGDGTLCTGPETAIRCQSCMAAKARVFQAMQTFLPEPLAAGALVAVSHFPWVARQKGLRGYVGDALERFQFLRRAFDDVDVAIAPSRFLLDIFVDNGYPREKFLLSPYGLDLSWLPRLESRDSNARLCFGYIGQIDPLKGVDILVEAFQTVSPGESAELRIYGDLKKNPSFTEKLGRVARGAPGVRFMGPFERPAIAEVLSAIDILVVPSIWYENTPLVIWEAFAAGKPVIATNLGGMSEAVEHEVNGLLFERGDVAGLARALQQLITDRDLRERLQRGIRPVRTIEEEVDALLRLYSDVRSSGLARVDRGSRA